MVQVASKRPYTKTRDNGPSSLDIDVLQKLPKMVLLSSKTRKERLESSGKLMMMNKMDDNFMDDDENNASVGNA
jgi:hypothetical protein